MPLQKHIGRRNISGALGRIIIRILKWLTTHYHVGMKGMGVVCHYKYKTLRPYLRSESVLGVRLDMPSRKSCMINGKDAQNKTWIPVYWSSMPYSPTTSLIS